MKWKIFDVVNKQFPTKPGLYLWHNNGDVGVFELLSNKPRSVPYDLRYYISQNKLVYLVFPPDYYPENFRFTHWTEANLP